jgi:hypothetical protein
MQVIWAIGASMIVLSLMQRRVAAAACGSVSRLSPATTSSIASGL